MLPNRSDPSRRGPHTSCDRASQPLNRPPSVSRISASGRVQLLVGPASAWSAEQMIGPASRHGPRRPGRTGPGTSRGAWRPTDVRTCRYRPASGTAGHIPQPSHRTNRCDPGWSARPRRPPSRAGVYVGSAQKYADPYVMSSIIRDARRRPFFAEVCSTTPPRLLFDDQNASCPAPRPDRHASTKQYARFFAKRCL